MCMLNISNDFYLIHVSMHATTKLMLWVNDSVCNFTFQLFECSTQTKCRDVNELASEGWIVRFLTLQILYLDVHSFIKLLRTILDQKISWWHTIWYTILYGNRIEIGSFNGKTKFCQAETKLFNESHYRCYVYSFILYLLLFFIIVYLLFICIYPILNSDLSQ